MWEERAQFSVLWDYLRITLNFLLKTQYIVTHNEKGNKLTVKLDFQMGIRIDWM